jgi:hypothetical protein
MLNTKIISVAMNTTITSPVHNPVGRLVPALAQPGYHKLGTINLSPETKPLPMSFELTMGLAGLAWPVALLYGMKALSPVLESHPTIAKITAIPLLGIMATSALSVPYGIKLTTQALTHFNFFRKIYFVLPLLSSAALGIGAGIIANRHDVTFFGVSFITLVTFGWCIAPSFTITDSDVHDGEIKLRFFPARKDNDKDDDDQRGGYVS